jgi:hypothetical protein
MAQDPVFAAELKKLKGKVLACWCSPNPCHGDVIAAVVEGWEPLFTETIDCTHCGGSGVYKWGACINGVYQHSGTCFQCRGTGKQTPEDQIRNHYYDLYGRKVRE